MVLERIKDKTLGVVGTSALVLAVFFLTPKSVSLVSAFVVVILAGIFVYLQSQWVESGADEWLLVIRDGKMLRAGIGMKTVTGMSDTVVKFPSKVERVNFSANNVTKEMQGIQITGFAFWTVFREEDGPFRCYKYMQGNDANTNVRALCESVVRSQIANSSLDQVLRQRHAIRDAVKKELKDQFKGWGVWLQTVQITEVLISSDKLFVDLQADFRQQTRVKAEEIKLQSNQKITQAKQISNAKIDQLTDNARTKREEIQNNESLKRKQLEANYDEKVNELSKKRMIREQQIALANQNNNFLINQERTKKNQALEELRNNFGREGIKKKIELTSLHNDRTLQKYELDSLVRIFERQQLRGIQVTSYQSGDKESMAAILPALTFGSAQVRAN